MDFSTMPAEGMAHRCRAVCRFLDSWTLTSCHFKVLFLESCDLAIPPGEESLQAGVLNSAGVLLCLGLDAFFWPQQTQIFLVSGSRMENKVC